MPLAERQLLNRLRSLKQVKSPRVALGIGDDCAILRLAPGYETLITTDLSLEGVHFRRRWQTPECIGHRCLVRGFSDIAAMGGRPVAAFLSLALPATVSQTWVDRFVGGLLGLARVHGVELAGGDTAQSAGGVLADIMVVGSVKRGRVLRRSGAKVGDLIYMTGNLGESAAAVHLLASGKMTKRDVFPQPKIEVGAWLATERIATSAIDISDGLSTDLGHICEQSGTGSEIKAAAVPINPLAKSLKETERSRRLPGCLSLELGLHGGEDYELLFTAPKSKRVPKEIAGVSITQIGEILGGRRMYLVHEGKRTILRPRGWEHFKSS